MKKKNVKVTWLKTNVKVTLSVRFEIAVINPVAMFLKFLSGAYCAAGTACWSSSPAAAR